MSLFATGDKPSTDKWNQKVLFVGAAAPASTFAGQLWFDTDNEKLQRRNAADSAWIDVTNSDVVPSTQAMGDAAAAGSSEENSRADHKHAMPAFAARTDLTFAAGADGIATTLARSDHRHGLPAGVLSEWYGAEEWFVGGGATGMVEASSTEGEPNFYRLINANNERVKLNVRVPSGATSVSAFLYLSGQGTASNSDITTRIVAEGENHRSGGQTDSLAITDNTTSNEVQILDVSAAFDAAGFVGGNELLQIEIRSNDTSPTAIIGIRLDYT